jgi:putative transposase
MYLPGVPAHVVQRGHNREPCFFDDQDYRFFLAQLGVGLRRHGVDLHAYVLMTNHVHLLVTPRCEAGISRLMSHLGRQFVQFSNRRHRRTGARWEGRHKASLVQAETYLLTCMRYIELNPVAAGIVRSPEHYRWSSSRWHASGEPDLLVTDHPIYQRLGSTPDARRQAYRELFRAHLDEHAVESIRRCVAFNHPLGDDRFREQIEAATGRRVGYAARGRPTAGGEP